MDLHKRWVANPLIGYFICAVVGAIMLCGYWWFAGKMFRTSDPFSVEVQMWSGRVANDPHGIGLWVIGNNLKGEKIAFHADIAVFLQTVNLQAFISQISSYNIKVKIRGGWVKTKRIDTRIGEICFVPPGGDFRNAYPLKPDTFFDHIISDHNMQPHETIRGWVLLKYPKGTELVIGPEKPEFRVFLKDSAGTSFDSGTLISKDRLTNDDAQLSRVLAKEGNTVDLSIFRQEGMLED